MAAFYLPEAVPCCLRKILLAGDCLSAPFVTWRTRATGLESGKRAGLPAEPSALQVHLMY